MLWNCCIKFFSNNFDNEYQYLQPMDSNYMYYPTTNYQTTTSTTKTIAVEQPTKNTSTVFSNRKIISKPLKKRYKKLILIILLFLKKKVKIKLNIYLYK